MIDLHSHVLPALDDGPPDLESSIALARAARARGTKVLAATPHIRDDHPFPLEDIADRMGVLERGLSDAGVGLKIVSGAEVAITKVMEMDDDTLRRLSLAGGSTLLVESPYTYAPELLESVLFEVQARGFRPLLAHPERSPSFLSDLVRLGRLVEGGVLCSVTSLSMTGAFGRTIRSFTARLFAEGLVHNVASDAHDARTRPPGLREGFEHLDGDVPGLAEQADWFTVDAPRAILGGEALPPRPQPPQIASRGWRRLLGRQRLVRQPG